MKKNNPTTKITKKPILTHKEKYIDGMFSLRLLPVNDAYLDEFAQEMLEWALFDENALKITQYYNLKRLHYKTIWDWMQRHEGLKEAHELALQVIGARRELGALNGKLDAGIVKYTQSMYEDSWKKLEEWKANIKAQAEGVAMGIKVVEIERFASSDMVPERKKDDEER